MIARHRGICPVCGVGIAKGRSRIARVPAMRPRPELLYWYSPDGRADSARAGWTWKRGHRDADMRPRSWVHERCAAKVSV